MSAKKRSRRTVRNTVLPPTRAARLNLDSEAWLRLWRRVLGGLLGIAAGVVAAALAADILGSTHSWTMGALGAGIGLVVGSWAGNSTHPRLRLIVGAAVMSVLGLALGWTFERVPGAVVGLAVGAIAGGLLAWALDALLRRIPARWLCVGFWGALAAVLTSAGIALLIRLTIGRLDDDDFAFHVTAIVVVCYWAARTGWLAEPRATGAAVRAQLRRVFTSFGRSPLFPFAIAVMVAGTVAGPAHAEFEILETATTLQIRRDLIFLAWPAALVIAAIWIAWRRRAAPAGRALAVIALLVTLACGYSAYSTVAYRVTADPARLHVHGDEILREELTRIHHERVTGRRYVLYRPVLVLKNETSIKLGTDSGSSATVRFLQQSWGVPVERPQ